MPKLDKARLEKLLILSINHKVVLQESPALEREWLKALREGTLEIEGYVKYQKLKLKENNESEQ